MADLVEDGKAKAAGIVSIMIAVFALGELICGFMLFGYGNTDGSGVWSGFGLAIVAVLGIVTWVKKNKTVMVFFLVLSILWFIVSIVQVVIGFLGWVIYSIFHEILKDCTVQDGKCVCADKSVPIDVSDCVYLDNIATIYMVVMILGALGAILLLSSSIIGCMGTCCASRTETNIVVVQQPGMVMQTHPPQYPVKAY